MCLSAVGSPIFGVFADRIYMYSGKSRPLDKGGGTIVQTLEYKGGTHENNFSGPLKLLFVLKKEGPCPSTSLGH